MTSHISSKWHSFFAVSYMFLMQVTDYQKRHICLEKCILEIQFFNSNWNTFLAMDLCRNLQIVTEENILKYSRILVFLRSIPTHLLLYTSFSQIQERSSFQAAIPGPTSCAENGPCLFMARPTNLQKLWTGQVLWPRSPISHLWNKKLFWFQTSSVRTDPLGITPERCLLTITQVLQPNCVLRWPRNLCAGLVKHRH